MQWGNRIIQDIIDATKFAVHLKIADPKRICIYGASFGGYAALQSAILAPDLFQCAIGYAGLYDLALMYEIGDIKRNKAGLAYLNKVIGEDKELLRRYSPIHNLDKLNTPVLLIHGKKDERCPLEQAEKMKDSLLEAKKEVEWMFVKREQHGFYDEDNRKEMYTKLLTFINKHIGTK